MKRKNSCLSQGTTATTVEIARKKWRLVKESELVSSQKGTSSSLPPRKSSSDKASKGKSKEGQSREASGSLPIALISNESGVYFQLSPDSSTTSIAKLLSNHVFGVSPNVADPRLVGIICRIVESTEQSASFIGQAEEDIFDASKR